MLASIEESGTNKPTHEEKSVKASKIEEKLTHWKQIKNEDNLFQMRSIKETKIKQNN